MIGQPLLPSRILGHQSYVKTSVPRTLRKLGPHRCHVSMTASSAVCDGRVKINGDRRVYLFEVNNSEQASRIQDITMLSGRKEEKRSLLRGFVRPPQPAQGPSTTYTVVTSVKGEVIVRTPDAGQGKEESGEMIME